MIKSDIVKVLSDRFLTLRKYDIEESVNVIVEELVEALCCKERIEVRGFGSFSLHHRPPRLAHNPKTGERLTTKAKYSPHFKPGKEMRERINAAAGRVRDGDTRY